MVFFSTADAGGRVTWRAARGLGRSVEETATPAASCRERFQRFQERDYANVAVGFGVPFQKIEDGAAVIDRYNRWRGLNGARSRNADP